METNLKNQLIQISAKNLGHLALDDYCPKCFWLKLKLKNKLPYQIFPGIFSSIDSYSKKITWGYYEKYKILPKWFNELGDFIKPIPVLHFSQFYYFDEKLNIKLTGIPDDIFLCSDNSYFIIDYKTSRFTKNQDKLLPLYLVQLNGYALIFEKMGLGKVNGLGLCYYEPKTDILENDIDKVIIEDGFKMAFEAHNTKLKLDPEGLLMPLMREVRRIGDMEVMPMGRKGCLDCERVEEMLKKYSSVVPAVRSG